MLITTMTIIIVSFLFLTWSLLSSMDKEYQSTNTNFESGFESTYTSFIPFSSQYFMVALIFLIFDLEIVLMLPLIMSNEWNKSMYMINLFLMLLTLVLFKELMLSSIEWVK